MKNIVMVFCGISVFLCFCSSENIDNGNSIVYSCKIDNVNRWSGSSECKKIKGHSGNYCAFVDSTKEFGFGFKMTLSEISDRQIKKVKFSCWALADNLSSNVTLLVSIEKNGKVFLWKGVKVSDFQTKKDEWCQLVGEADIPNDVPKDSNVLMYIWSPDKTSALADDFEISFE